ncbi:MAG: hypothetical protein KJ787_14040 [Gammaproteobacteria bacterium]|nr:hypothetical protein [Gammaproteobacteria bacterium]MBU1647448.1 hypothetical protein [Gammaproteobacteria bacterium]MBU1973240.1 hypothetical protein [Gammaproteobacteria bacterium]
MTEAERLQQLFKDINRAKFARDTAFPGGQSMIYQHITGRKPISPECADAYCSGLNITLDQLSPRLAEIATKLANHLPRAYANGGTVTVLQARAPNAIDPVVQQITDAATVMNETGRARLLERAEQLREQYPLRVKNHSN